jgi:hypothetical protein
MNFFENTTLHSSSTKLFNSKLNEWISYMPPHFQALGSILTLPTLAMEFLDKNIKTNTNTNKHVYLMSVLSIFRHKSDIIPHFSDEYITELYVTWKDIFNKNEAPIIERRLENKPTDKQLAKGGHKITFSQIVEKRNELPVGSNERLLLSMYTMIPPCRADYFSTQIIRDDEVPTQKNYIHFKGTDYAECFINDFKTAKTYKQIKHVLPPELISEINSSLQKNPRTYLFINTKGEPHTRNSFVLWTRRCLTRIFETDFTLVFFRHAFVTDFITNKITPETTDAEIKEISDKMGHSPEMFRGYKWIKSGAKGVFEVGGDD